MSEAILGSEVRTLALAIIEAAIHDAKLEFPAAPKPDDYPKVWRGKGVVYDRALKSYEDRCREIGRERDEAVLFLTAEKGAWSQSLNTWAEMADLDPAYVREHARKSLGSAERAIRM